MRRAVAERGVWAVAIVAFASLLACGDSDGGAGDAPGSGSSCDQLIVGLDFSSDCSAAPNATWELERYCPFPEGFDPLGGTCESATYATSGRASGTLELRDNGLFRFEWQERLLEVESAIPTLCYGDGDFCRGSALGGSCIVEGTTCRCNETRVELDSVEQGSWTATPGALRFDESSGLTVEQRYCVDRTLGWMVVERPAAFGLPGARLLFRRR